MLEFFAELLVYALLELFWRGIIVTTGHAFVWACTLGHVKPDDVTAAFFGVLVWVAAVIGFCAWLYR